MLDYIQLANALIDNYCETFGISNCIRYLHGFDLTRDDLLRLGFEAEDIDDALEDD